MQSFLNPTARQTATRFFYFRGSYFDNQGGFRQNKQEASVLKNKIMERTLVSEAFKKAGEEINLQGFVNNIRHQGSIAFIELRDRSGIMQAVVMKSSEAFDLTKNLSLESVVSLSGKTKEEKQAPGGVEMEVAEIEILSLADPELPIPVLDKGDNESNQTARMNWRYLDLRKPKNNLIFQVWTAMETGFRSYLIKENFIQIHSPKMMSTGSEGGAELFEVKYFKRKAFLAQSPQFYKQMAQSAGLERVFEIGPVFRADPSFTSRHATEFTGFDLEMSFIKDHHDVMNLQAELLANMISEVKKVCGKNVQETFKVELNVPKLPFPKVTIAEAKKMLAEKKIPSETDGDLSPEEERVLGNIIKERDDHDIVFVTDYPISNRPFYHMRDEKNPQLTKSYDLLYKGVEITTGAQREHRYEILLQQAKEKNIDIKDIEHYLNFFKYGCPPHGGFGMGPARVVMKMLNLENIREVTYLYRGVKRLTP